MSAERDEIRAILERHLKQTIYRHLRAVENESTEALENSLVSYCEGLIYAQLRERGVEEYLALRYADDPIEAFNLFIKAWVPERYHEHLLDNDENDGQFVRNHINSARGVVTI